jgi:hypothetical protein
MRGSLRIPIPICYRSSQEAVCVSSYLCDNDGDGSWLSSLHGGIALASLNNGTGHVAATQDRASLLEGASGMPTDRTNDRKIGSDWGLADLRWIKK